MLDKSVDKWWEQLNPNADWARLYELDPEADWASFFNQIPDKFIEEDE